MHAARQNDRITLSFRLSESRVVHRVLKAIVQNYKISPDELDPKVADAWYSTRGCQTAKMSTEETKEWLEHLYQYKGANLRLVEKWVKKFSGPKANQYYLRLKLEEAPALLTVLNDHRLLMAARHGIGQEEMDLNSLSAFSQLQPAQQTALYEIEFLARIIEEILRLLPGNPAGWLDPD